MTICGLKDSHSLAPPGIQPLPLPPFPLLQSLELNEIGCGKFANNFDLSYISALHTISLKDCISPVALLRLLLPILGGADRGTMLPLLRVIELTHVGEEEANIICEIIRHRHACGKPIEAIVFDPVSLNRFPDRVEWMKQHVAVRQGQPVLYPEELMALSWAR
jgi:hypothetical protein